jgi:hypothetical protein
MQMAFNTLIMLNFYPTNPADTCASNELDRKFAWNIVALWSDTIVVALGRMGISCSDDGDRAVIAARGRSPFGARAGR